MACAGLLTTEGADQFKPCVGLDCGCARLQRTSGRLSDFWRSMVVRTREFARGGVVGQLHLSTTQTGVRRTRIRCELAHQAVMCPTRGTQPGGSLARSHRLIFGTTACLGTRACQAACGAGGGIRTLEPLRDGSLSPTPLTMLGDPRASVAFDQRSKKPAKG